MRGIRIFFIFFFCTVSAAFAAPEITQVAGTLQHGESITISGSGFGEKATAAPIRWDTFESGTPEQNIGTSEFWSTVNGFLYSDEATQRTGLSDQFIRIPAESGVVSGDSHAHISQWSTSKKKLLVGWYRVDFISAGSGQIKLMNIERAASHATAPGIAEHAFWCYNNTCVGGTTNQLGTGNGNVAYWYQGPTLVVLQQFTFNVYYDGEWQYFMIEYEESDYNVANGQARLYKSSTAPTKTAIERLTSINKLSQSSDGSVAEYAKLRAITASDTVRANVYYDDIYIDNTWQRVEIGDNATYANCTHREMQIPTAWDGVSGTNSISITVNRGAFGSTDSAYLYVVDADGTVNETGYAITFGDTGETPTISAPSGFRAVGGTEWR